MNKFTKIIATLGPVSSSYDTILEMVNEGADVFRMNFSHGSFDDHYEVLKNVIQVRKDTGKHVSVFMDLQGPKIRIGKLESDFIDLIEGQEFIVTTEDMIGKDNMVSIDYTNLHNEAVPGNKILIDDGNIELEVLRISGKKIYTKVLNGGHLKQRKGVNLPYIKLEKLSSVTEKDIKDLEFAYLHDLDFVALSFVRTAADVTHLKNIMMQKYGKIIPVIAKIETPQAVDDIDNILDVADAVMVARGDLGVETSTEELPLAQKKIINRCNLRGIPVITATQMLDSMIYNPRPTRAEANDVANSIMDGTDAVMLSGETTVGKYPIEAIRVMKKIALKIEQSELYISKFYRYRLFLSDLSNTSGVSVSEAVGLSAVELAEKIKAKLIVSFTISGGTARLVAKYRPNIPIIAFSPIINMAQKLSLVWGVTPLEIDDISSVDELLEAAKVQLKNRKLVQPGDKVVITAGVPVGWTGKTNMIKVVVI